MKDALFPFVHFCLHSLKYYVLKQVWNDNAITFEVGITYDNHFACISMLNFFLLFSSEFETEYAFKILMHWFIKIPLYLLFAWNHSVSVVNKWEI